MKKDQLKPGQILAFQAVNSHQIRPALLVGAEMWQTKDVTEGGGWTPKVVARKLVKAPKGAVAHDGIGRGNKRTGYLVLWYRQHAFHKYETRTEVLTIEQQAELLREQAERIVTLQMEARDGTERKDLHYGPELCWGFLSGRVLIGEWDEVYAAHSAATEATHAFNEKGAAWEESRNADLREAATMLEEITGTAPYTRSATYRPAPVGSGEDGVYHGEGSITLKLEDVQKLLALVAQRN